MNPTIKRDTRRSKTNLSRLVAAGCAGLGIVIIGLGVRQALVRPDERSVADSRHMSTFLDIGHALTADIERVVKPAITRTQRAALSPGLVSAVQAGDRAAATAECNAIITGSTEIDAIAVFDASGTILSMNSVYADGRPIAKERLDRVLKADFSGREIIQSCAKNSANTGVLEFQTTCDITPALFDSTGLSIAYSMPILDPATGAKRGVVSTRLRFERLTDLIKARKLGVSDQAIEFVTDQGTYFSEAINSGAKQAPVSPQDLAIDVAPLASGHVDNTLLQHGDDYVGLFRMAGLATLEHGGVQVMLVLGRDALQNEAALVRRVQVAKTFGAGLLCFVIAGVIYGLSRIRAADDRAVRLIEDSTDAIIAVDGSDRVQTWNRRAEEMFGYSRAEAIGQPLTALLQPGHPGPPWLSGLVAAADTQSVRTGGPPHHEASAKHKSGAILNLELSLAPHSGAAAGSVSAFVRDVTERKRLETQLAQSQKLESIGLLAAGIAHEINTPIQFIGDNVRFLREQFDTLMRVLSHCEAQLHPGDASVASPPRPEELALAFKDLDLAFISAEVPLALEQSRDGLERVAKIVRAMKEFAHPGSTTKEPADLNKAIASTVTVCMNRWKYVADVDLDLDPSIPSVPCLLAEINQVMLNLIVNAADAIAERRGPEGGKGRILVSTRRAGASVEIRVQDDAGGIPEAVREKIFSPFFTTKPVGKGTGQGLAISRSIVVDRHAGSLRFETESGKGTTFVVILPLPSGQAAAPLADVAAKEAA